MKRKRVSPTNSGQLDLLGSIAAPRGKNPYANVPGSEDDGELLTRIGWPSAGLLQPVVARAQPVITLAPYVRHPYAIASMEAASEVDDPMIRRRLPERRTASKVDFRRECVRILTQYVPPAQGSRLPKNFRNFIDRNEARSPAARGAVIAGLRKYDLSASVGVGHFHRTQEGLTDEKLFQIENAADDVE